MPLPTGQPPTGDAHPQLRKISLSYQGMPPIYSDTSFSSLLLLSVLPEIGWSRGFNCASPGSAHSIPEMKPVLQDSKPSRRPQKLEECLIHTAFPPKHLTKLWFGPSHLSTTPSPHMHWSDRYQAVFPTLELFHLWSTHAKSFSPTRCPLADNYSSELFEVVRILVQDRWGPPPTTHVPPFSICPSKSSQPPRYISECASISLLTITMILWSILIHVCNKLRNFSKCTKLFIQPK